MKSALTTVLTLIFCISATYAQDDQYIVKLNGDTIRGKLQINPLRDNSTSMFFKHEDGTKENIRPIRVSYVFYDNETRFRSIPFYNQRLFMQIVKEDRNLSYYHYINKRDNSVSTNKILAKPNGDAIELSALSFKKNISEFLDDCPGVVAKIESRQYKYKDLDLILEEYNNCQVHTTVASSVNKNAPVETGDPAESVAATETAIGSGVSAKTSGSENVKLAQIDDFRKYVRELDDFEHSRDVLEWLTDVEYRVSQNREIPNYLWNSLSAMTAGNEELDNKASQLKTVLVGD